VVEKYGYEVQILKTDLTWEDACELEMILISYYGRKDLNKGKLVNKTDGGDGTIGCHSTRKGVKRSDDTINKIKKSLEGFKLSDSQKIRHKENTHSGENHHFYGTTGGFHGRKHSEESLKKMGTEVIHMETGEEWITIKKCSESIGYSYRYVLGMLSGRYKNTAKIMYKNGTKS